jgi:hypothetical protein
MDARSIANVEAAFASEQRRSAIRGEYDAAIRYIDGDMLEDVEGALARSYGASQRDPDSANRIEAVAVALVQLYVDEMASLYTGQVTRRFMRGDKPADDVGDVVLEHLERIAYNQRMTAVERRTVLLGSCGMLYGVAGGALDPIVYPPQDVYPVPPKGERINRANQDAYAGFALDLRAPSESGRHEYAYVQPSDVSIYDGSGPGDVHEVKSTSPNSLTWSAPTVSADGRVSGQSDQRLQPLVLWHNEQPVNEVLPIATPTLYRANRWLNVLWSVILDVLRFQCGATLSLTLNDAQSTKTNRPVGVRYPLVLENGEAGVYLPAGNDYAGMVSLLSSFAKTLGLTLRISPDDLSLERTAESGIARQIANIPKDRARAERARHFALLEQHYAWPRIAAGMTWLGLLGSSARDVRMVTEYKPQSMPTNRLEQIQIERHDLDTGLATQARVLAERLGISEEDAQASLTEMRRRQSDASDTEPAAAPPLEVGKVQALMGVFDAVGAGKLKPETAQVLLVDVFGLTEERAQSMIAPYLVEDEPAPEQPGEEQAVAPAPPDDESMRRGLIEKLATAKKIKKEEGKPDGVDGSTA